jgi:hypothetical protein
VCGCIDFLGESFWDYLQRNQRLYLLRDLASFYFDSHRFRLSTSESESKITSGTFGKKNIEFSIRKNLSREFESILTSIPFSIGARLLKLGT